MKDAVAGEWALCKRLVDDQQDFIEARGPIPIKTHLKDLRTLAREKYRLVGRVKKTKGALKEFEAAQAAYRNARSANASEDAKAELRTLMREARTAHEDAKKREARSRRKIKQVHAERDQRRGPRGMAKRVANMKIGGTLIKSFTVTVRNGSVFVDPSVEEQEIFEKGDWLRIGPAFKDIDEMHRAQKHRRKEARAALMAAEGAGGGDGDGAAAGGGAKADGQGYEVEIDDVLSGPSDHETAKPLLGPSGLLHFRAVKNTGKPTMMQSFTLAIRRQVVQTLINIEKQVKELMADDDDENISAEQMKLMAAKEEEELEARLPKWRFDKADLRKIRINRMWTFEDGDELAVYRVPKQ